MSYPNQQRTPNKLPTELRCRIFLISTDLSMQIGTKRAKTCMQRAHVPTEHPFCEPLLVVGITCHQVFGLIHCVCWSGFQTALRKAKKYVSRIAGGRRMANFKQLAERAKKKEFAIFFFSFSLFRMHEHGHLLRKGEKKIFFACTATLFSLLVSHCRKTGWFTFF